MISLVDSPANQRKLIWKSANDKIKNIEKLITFKSDAEKRKIYGIVYSPDDVDAHGEFASAATIEKSSDGFMKRSNTSAIDTQHSFEVADNVYLTESWIVRKNDAIFPDDEGAWAVCIKVDNDEIWDQIKSGELTGLSLWGFAEKAVVKKTDDTDEADETEVMTAIEKLGNTISKIFKSKSMDKVEVKKQEFEKYLLQFSLEKILCAVSNSVQDVIYQWGMENVNLSDADKAAKIKDIFDKAKTEIDKIEVAKSEIKKAGKTLSAANMQKLQDAIDAMNGILENANKIKDKGVSKMETKKAEEKQEDKTEVAKSVDELQKDVVAKDAKITELETAKIDLETKISELEKKVATSKQSDEVETEKTEVKKKGLSLLS